MARNRRSVEENDWRHRWSSVRLSRDIRIQWRRTSDLGSLGCGCQPDVCFGFPWKHRTSSFTGISSGVLDNLSVSCFLTISRALPRWSSIYEYDVSCFWNASLFIFFNISVLCKGKNMNMFCAVSLCQTTAEERIQFRESIKRPLELLNGSQDQSLSRNKLKKLRRNSKKNFDPKPDKFDKCTCGNPKVST